MTLRDAEFYAVGMYFRCKLDLSDLEDPENTAFLVDFREFNSETVVVMKFPWIPQLPWIISLQPARAGAA